MGCQLGRVIIVNNEGTIIFGNVATINIKETSVSTNGSGSSITDESAQNEENASASGTVTSKRSKSHRYKPR
ncbi:MAG: hypothetical protein ACQEXQ_06915 [Bacillota bacterium]